jgi:ADP-heptose:LPS heptosyltransferase
VKPWCLVARLGGIGDNLIASSVLPLLAERFNVEMMAQAPQHVVFEHNPHIAKLTVREAGDLPADGNTWQAWFAHRGREYDRWFNLSHSCETTLALVPGQTQFYWPAAWRRQRCGVNYLEFVHQICEVGAPYNPRFFPTEAEAERAAQTLVKVREGHRHVVGIVLSGSRLDKSWPYMPLLVAKLIRELNTAVVLFGSEPETKIAKAIQDFVREYTGSYAGMHAAISPDAAKPSWPIRRALATLHACDLVIGPDTGLMWGVAMEPMPKIMLLSHASPENITKHWVNTMTLHADRVRVDCWPCHQLHDVKETCRKAENAEAAACIADITDEAVFIAARAALEGDDAHGRYRGLRREGDAGLVAQRGGGDPTGGVERWLVSGSPVIDLGFGNPHRLGHDAAVAVDGGGGVAGGVCLEHGGDDVRADPVVSDD